MPDPSRQPRHFVVLTGAGISADSGVATFRGAGGLWEGHRIEDVATPQAWDRNPSLVWRFYQLRRAQLATVFPNPAHVAIAFAENELRKTGEHLTLITQNVDNLHDRAGSSTLHMHGELSKLRCERCHDTHENLSDFKPDTFIECKHCGFPRLRPDIVWFGEVPMHLSAIETAIRSATVFLSIGTSGLVYPAAGLLSDARRRGIRTIVNSLDPPENLDPDDEFHPGRAAEVVPRLMQQLLSNR